MSADKAKKSQPRSRRISTTGGHEVSLWASTFGVSRGELLRAIEEVGNSVASLRIRLGKQAQRLSHGRNGRSTSR